MGLSLIREEIVSIRERDFEQLECPTCGGELNYDRSVSSLACSNKDACVFSISYTESGRESILWDIRCETLKTDPARFARLVMEIASRLDTGEPLAQNARNLAIVKQRSPVEKLAKKFRLEMEDVFSIKYSSETPRELSLFYGLPVKVIKEIKDADIEEE